MRVPAFLALWLGLFAIAASAAAFGGAMLMDRDLRRERAGAAAQAEMDAFLAGKLATPTAGAQGPALAKGLAGAVGGHESPVDKQGADRDGAGHGGPADLARQVAAFRAMGPQAPEKVFLYRRGQAVSGSQPAWPGDARPFRHGLILYTLGGVEAVAAVHDFPGGDRLLIGRLVDRASLMSPPVVRVGALTVIGLVLTGLVVAGVFAVDYDRRLRAITDACLRVERGEMSARAPGGERHDEFGALARRVNLMLDRVQRYVDGMRGVSDEIAHDLRTPLNRIQARLATVREQLPEPQRAQLDEAAGDVRDLARTVDDFLWLREVEAGQGGETAFFGLRALCETVAEDHALLAEDAKGIHVSVEGPEVEILGVRSLLVRAVDNVVANAVKFTPPGGVIVVRVGRAPGLARVAVEDTGPGMSAELLAVAIQPGVRGDGPQAGHGLGLAIAASVARRHGGDLTLSNLPTGGLRVALDLPIPV